MYHAEAEARMISPKPLLRQIQYPIKQRRYGRNRLMTLAAAFRGPKGGILLCSDREWNYGGVSKRQINKNYRVGLLKQCEIFISGAGLDAPLIRAWEEIHQHLFNAEASGIDILVEHRKNY